MRGDRYRSRTPILGIYTDPSQHRIPITIPQGALVEVEAGVNGSRLVDVIWEDKVVMMFTIDLRNRCDKVEGASV